MNYDDYLRYLSRVYGDDQRTAGGNWLDRRDDRDDTPREVPLGFNPRSTTPQIQLLGAR